MIKTKSILIFCLSILLVSLVYILSVSINAINSDGKDSGFISGSLMSSVQDSGISDEGKVKVETINIDKKVKVKENKNSKKSSSGGSSGSSVDLLPESQLSVIDIPEVPIVQEVAASEPGLVFYESFDSPESILNNSCILCSATSFNSGIRGNSAYFSNSNYLRYPALENIDKNKGTVSLWVKPNNLSVAGGFFDYGEIGIIGSNLGVFKPSWNAVYLESRADNSENGLQISGSDVLSPSEWTQVTFVWQTNNQTSFFQLYINGDYVGTRIFLSGYNLNPLYDYFSVGRTGWYGVANAYLDDLKIYNYVRSPSEIEQDYRSYSSVCSTDVQCGTNGFTGNRVCQGDDVYQDYTVYTCNNPGTVSSFCSNSSTLQLFEECLDGCTNGACNTIAVPSLVFYESFDNQSSIEANGGNSSVGEYNFISGIKGNAIDLTKQIFGIYLRDNYINYSTNEQFKKGSINFWVKVPKNISYQKYGQSYTNWFDVSKGFFDTGRTGGVNSLGIFSSNWNTDISPNKSNAYVELGTYGGYVQTASSINLSDYNWHYISVNWLCNNVGGDYFNLYIDGQIKSTRNLNSGCNYFGTDTNDFWIGKNAAYSTSLAYFDEFKIYNFPRNSTQVNQDYQSYIGVCAMNSQCGVDGFTGNRVCQGDDVYQDYTVYTCNNPGTVSSFCSNSSTLQLFEECSNGCTSGFCNVASVKNVSTGNVKVVGRDLIVNGMKYTVKSVGYAPVPIGQTPDWGYDITVHPELRARDFPLIRAMNANTIRTWGKVGQGSFLDDAWNNGTKPIRVIMGYWMGNDKDYTNQAVRDSVKADFSSYVQTYKNYPAVLVWAIGNEENHFYANGDNLKHAAYFSLVNEMAELAYQIEGANYHPVMAVSLEFPNEMTTVGSVAGGSDDASIPYVDMWGINHYPGASFGNFFNTYNSKTARPLIITEFGIDAFNNSAQSEYESVQATWDVNLWNEIKSNAVGGSLMEYCDEFWKSYGGSVSVHDDGGYVTTSHPDFFSNEEWWGIVRTVDNGSGIDIMQPRQAYYALKEVWKNPDCNGADIDGNGFVDWGDLQLFQSALNQPGYCGYADMNDDGVLDASDYITLKMNFGFSSGACVQRVLNC